MKTSQSRSAKKKIVICFLSLPLLKAEAYVTKADGESQLLLGYLLHFLFPIKVSPCPFLIIKIS